MTKGMRYGLAALCVAALAGLALVAIAADETPSSAAALLWTLMALVVLVTAPAGLVAVAVALVRGPTGSRRQG